MSKRLMENYRDRSLSCGITCLSKKILTTKDDVPINNILNKKVTRKLLNIPKDIKSVRELHSEAIKYPFTIYPEDFQQFYEHYYKKSIEKKIKQIEREKDELYACNAIGHGPLFFFTLFDPDNRSLKPFIKSFKIFFITLTKIPFPIKYHTPRFYLFTVQDNFYPYFTPSSNALPEQSLLLQNQKKMLKKYHDKKGIDKEYYTGSYGNYFQLIYKPLDWFGTYKGDYIDKRYKSKSRYIFDAEILLSKITREMNDHNISDARKKEFIYFNMGWIFGRKDASTIEYDPKYFLKHCLPYTNQRNEVIIKWIIPVNLEYGCVWVSEPTEYGTTYY